MIKIIAILAFAALLALLTGCGDKKSKDEQAETTADTSATAVNETVATAMPDTMATADTSIVTTFVDSRDQKTYKSVKIFEQTWMAENLNYEAKNSKCYDDKPANCTKYGRLYDWNTAMKTCPSGWHLPSDDEWYVLVNATDSRYEAGKLKSKSGWNENNGTDDFGFSALPGGDGYSDGYFANVEFWGRWWSSTRNNLPKSWGMDSDYNTFGDETFDRVFDIFGSDESNLYSVRCVED